MADTEINDDDEMNAGGVVLDLDDGTGDGTGDDADVDAEIAAEAPDDPPEPPEVRRPPPPPRRRPPPPPKPRKPESARMADERVEDDLAEIFSNLDVGGDECEVKVYRVRPRTDPETGEEIHGYVDTITSPQFTVADLKARFGGGTYRVQVRGPRNGRANVILANKTIPVAGPPKVKAKAPVNDEERSPLIAKLFEQQTKQQEQSEKRIEQLQSEQRDYQKTILELFAKANEKKEDPVTPMLQMMREENRLREERDREERKERMEQERRDREDRERRDREVREEQRRRDEETRRQHEREQKAAEERFALQMKQLEVQQQQMEARMRAEAAASKESMQFMLSFMRDNDKEKEARSRDMMKMQMEAVKQNADTTRSMYEQQMKLITEQFKNKEDFFETFSKLQAINEMIHPPEPDSPAWERAIDKATEAVQNIVPGLAMLRASGPDKQQAAGGGAGQPRLAPGSVAVVENYEEVDDDDDVEASVVGDGSLSTQATAAATTPTPEVLPPEQRPQTQESGVPVNPITEYQLYNPEADNEALFTVLVQNLDLAMQRDAEVSVVYDNCIAPLPAKISNILRSAPADLLVGFIAANVPDEWALRSMQAEEKVRAVHAMLVEAGV